MMRMAILKTVHLRYKTFGRRITLVIFSLAIIAKLKCDDLYNINDKIITLCYASANFIFLLKNKKKPDLIGLFRVVRATGLEPAHRLTLEPKSSASANSATPARVYFNKLTLRKSKYYIVSLR